MKGREDWSESTNPKTGKKFAQFLEYLKLAHDGTMDLDRLLDSEYGAEIAKRLDLRFRFEDDAMGEAALAYYRSIGLRKELFDGEDYYTRWVLFSPLAALGSASTGKRYPLVFSQHGGGSSIETEEFSCGYPQLAGQEQFFVAILQDTNWDSVSRVLDRILAEYPVDPGRVYMSGLSQGGSQTNTCLHRMPDRFAAVAPNSCDFIRTSDNFDVPFTQEELHRVAEAVVPVIYTVGACDASYYVPLNQWRPRKSWDGKLGDPETYKPKDRDNEKDPTWIHNPAKGFRDAARKRMVKEPNWWMCHPMHPEEGEAPGTWAIDRVNRRLNLLGCKAVDPDRCLAFAGQPEDEFHHLLGIYGDREAVTEYFGWKHYVLNSFNAAGINTFRMVVVENFPHWQSVMMARLCWDFFRQFHRDPETGELVQNESTVLSCDERNDPVMV